jgi:PTS system fructose-specific IIC component
LQLLDYINPKCVRVGLASPDKDAALRIMVDLAVEQGLVRDGKLLMHAVKAREEVVSTGIGNGVAIPHADLPEIESPQLAVGVFPGGVDYDALDEEPVHVVFLLMGTPRTPGLHMRILALIARLCKDPGFARGLSRAERPEDVLSILGRIESKHWNSSGQESS